MRRPFVVVSGPPASGKTTLAGEVAAHLRLPVVATDTIKDALMTNLGVPDIETSRQLGRAAVAAMLAVARESPVGAVIDSNFDRSIAGDDLATLPGTVVEVFCRCDRDVAIARYRARIGTRHAGHFDAARTSGEIWHEDVTEPVGGDWPLLEADTNRPVDVEALVSRIADLIGLSVNKAGIGP